MDTELQELLMVPTTDATREQVEDVIVRWRSQRDARLDAEKVAARFKEDEDSMKSWLLDVFDKQRYEGMVIGGKITGIAYREVPVVADRLELESYILSTGDLTLLQFSISTTAVNEHLDNGETIPGIELREVRQLYDRKV